MFKVVVATVILGLLLLPSPHALGVDETDLITATDRICESVVLVSVSAMLPNDLGTELIEAQLTGSGFSIAPGLIVTNYHVIQDATRIEVVLRNRDISSATIVGTAPGYDLALLRVPFGVDQLPTAPLGSAEGLRLGQTVLTVSNPLGLQHSVSRGVISGLRREIPGLEFGSRLIQFDASINEGQSGGPLIDADGRVIGVTTFKILGAEAIGFALPIDLAVKTIPDLERMGHPFRPNLGISGTEVDPSLAALFDLPVSWGVLVEVVEHESVADEAGIRAGHRIVPLRGRDYVLGGDIIVAVDGRPVRGAAGLMDALLNAGPAQILKLELVRGGERLSIPLAVPEMEH